MSGEPTRKLVKIWLPHQNVRQQIRNLKRRVQPIIDSKDPDIILAGLRAMQATQDEPDPEFGALHLMASALDISEEMKLPWAQVMNDLINTYNQPPSNERNDNNAGTTSSN